MTEIFVEIADTRGSTPRDTGTVMKVTKQGTFGTIGGGRLEFEAIEMARKMIDDRAEQRVTRTFPLGPNLGQCCGGSVELCFSRSARDVDHRHVVRLVPTPKAASPQVLWLWGAGHVGRAVVDIAPTDAFEIHWVDTSAARFPADIPAHVSPLVATDMPRLAHRAPARAHHLVFTYSHDIDLALCAALLGQETASIGLIGSATKRARFFKHLRAAGLSPDRIVCPIGDKSLGKHPDRIAQGVINGFLRSQAA